MDLRTLLAFRNLVLFQTEEEKRSLAQKLNIDYEEYQRRMIGKNKEDEFIIILYSLGMIKHLEAYDEDFSHITQEYTPDFKIEMPDGYKMLLEIKHTDKAEFKISLGNLNKRIDFAKHQGLPLQFAISLKGIWGIFTAEQLKEKHGRLTYTDFYGCQSCSWLETELGTCLYVFDKPIKFRSVYSTKPSKGMGIQFSPYGELVSYELYYDDRRIFRAKGKNSIYILYSIYLEALHDVVANTHQDIKQDGDFTTIIDYTDTAYPLKIPEYQFLLSPICHMQNRYGSRPLMYDVHSAISDHDFKYFDVQVLRCIMFELSQLGLDILIHRNNQYYTFDEYCKQFLGHSPNLQD